ncbi:MAG: transketolase C-terminal domain-containing protein [Trueperaceae bacterium]
MTYDAPTPIRDAFGKALVELGTTNPDVVVLTADLAEAVKVHWFAEAHPRRFFQMGIAESDMMGTAAGLALGGKIPFATTFAVFATSLANQAVRLSIAYNRANVKIAASHGGLTVGEDGATHQAIEDLALMRLLPGMTVVAPCDAIEAHKAVFAVAAHQGPVYMRLGRVPTPILTTEDTPFVLGRANVQRQGRDVAIVSIGTMLHQALQAAEALATQGIEARVINMHTLKPLDREVLDAAARDCGGIVTIEEHTVLGGLGGAVAEYLAGTQPTRVEMVGIQDTFGESGPPDRLLEKYGITADAVVQAAKRLLREQPTVR